jgi:hypothetical protein
MFFLEKRREELFSFFLKGTRRKRALERKQFLYFEEVLHTRLSESRHKLYVTKYHPLKQ